MKDYWEGFWRGASAFCAYGIILKHITGPSDSLITNPSPGYVPQDSVWIATEDFNKDGRGKTVLRYKNQIYLLKEQGDSLHIVGYGGLEQITYETTGQYSVIKEVPLK